MQFVVATSPDTACHYCGLWQGNTRDHVVPLSIIFPLESQAKLPSPTENIVRACRDCNSHKRSDRVIHDCGICTGIWQRFGPCDWESAVPTVSLKQVTGRARGRYKVYLRTLPRRQKQAMSRTTPVG